MYEQSCIYLTPCKGQISKTNYSIIFIYEGTSISLIIIINRIFYELTEFKKIKSTLRFMTSKQADLFTAYIESKSNRTFVSVNTLFIYRDTGRSLKEQLSLTCTK